MSDEHFFGGDWTDEKLDRLRKYLAAYTTIFTRNPRAAKLGTIYVDAFAGTGYRQTKKEIASGSSLLFDDDAASFKKGSAQIALETSPPFDQYIFVELNKRRVEELERLRELFPESASRISVVQEDANSFVPRWCSSTDWQANRAVVFLDPYGMETDWSTLEAMAATKAIDLWLLFPVGQAVNRMLIRKKPPAGAWAAGLTRFFGTDEWEGAFYKRHREQTLFGPVDSVQKEADFDAIGRFFVQRLDSVFERVARNPLALRNSRNIVIYLLCFGAANPKGAGTAVKIASHILGK